MEWVNVLADMDVAVEVTSPGRVLLRSLDSTEAAFQICHVNRQPRPAESFPQPQPALLIAPHLSRSQQRRFIDASWSFVTEDGCAYLNMGSRVVRSESVENGRGLAPSQLRLLSPAKSRVLHALLNKPDSPQTVIAADAGVTQPYVHTILRQLRTAGYSPSSGEPKAKADLVDFWLAARSWNPITTYWAGAQSLLEAVDIVSARFDDSWLVSGDVAVDIEAPWTRPSTLVAITYEGGLRDSVLVQVTDQRQAQVILHVVDDSLVAAGSRPAKWNGRSVNLANQWQIAWDLHSSTAPDHRDALQQFLSTSMRRNRFKPSTQ